MATIADLLDERSIDLSLSSGDKDDVIERMVDLVDASGALLDRDVLIKAVRAREEAGTTGLGDGIAIPHGKCDGVDRPALAFARSDEGVSWGAPDGSLANLVFLIAVPEAAAGNAATTSAGVESGAYELTYTLIAPFKVPTIFVLVGASKVPSVVLAKAEVVAD